MNRVISKFLFPTASRAVSFRTIFFYKRIFGTGISSKKKKKKAQAKAKAKADRNAIKIKDNFLKSYNQRGIRGLRSIDILNFMDLVDGEKDMANLSRVVEDFLAQAGDTNHTKQSLLCKCIQTCYLRGDLKYSRLLKIRTFCLVLCPDGPL